MPSKTPKQQRAMAAAAGGNSTIGIPKSVGKEYMQADILRKKSMDGGSNQPTKTPTQGNGKRYGNFTDPTGKHHTHWKEGKSYSTGGTSGGGSVGGGGAG